MTINKMIKSWRSNRNFTQARLAQEAGWSVSTVNNLERGTRVTKAQLMSLIKILSPDNPKEWIFYYLAQGSLFSEEILQKLCSLYLQLPE